MNAFRFSSIMAGLSLAVTQFAPAAPIFTDNFETGNTVGNNPVNYTVTPASATSQSGTATSTTGGVGAIVVGSANNPAGTGNGLRVYDYNTATSGTNTASANRNFVANAGGNVNSVLATFDVATNVPLASGNLVTFIGVGGFGAPGPSSSSRQASVTISNDSAKTNGAFGYDATGGPALIAIPSRPITFSIVANGGMAGALTYSSLVDGSSRTIAANTFDVYYKSGAGAYTLYTTTAAAIKNPGTTAGFGSFYVGTQGSQAGYDVVLDNISVSTVPVPEPTALAALGGLGLTMLRRRRANV